MEAFYSKDMYIGVSMCDASGRLGLSNAFAVFQDAASEHAEQLGVGNAVMADQGLFWVTTRTRVRFHRRPKLMEQVRISTWPVAPGAGRCDRLYRINAMDGELLCEGRTEWCVLDVKSGRPCPPAKVFPADIEYCGFQQLTEPYARYRHDFADGDCAVTRDVRPSDVDLGRHMNNVAYLRLLCDSFSLEELEREDVQEMEIWFCMPCFEGDALDVMRRRTDYGYEFGVKRPDGRYAALARMVSDRQ